MQEREDASYSIKQCLSLVTLTVDRVPRRSTAERSLSLYWLFCMAVPEYAVHYEAKFSNLNSVVNIPSSANNGKV